MLGLIEPVDLPAVDLDAVAGGTRRLRTADAIHLATAQRLGVTATLVYEADWRPRPTRRDFR